IRGLKSAVYIDGELNNPAADNHFWSIELLIPWQPLRECGVDECKPSHIVPDKGELWRLNFSRVEYRMDVVGAQYVKRTNPATGQPYPEYNWVWAPTGVIDIHMPELWGYLVFGDEHTKFVMPEDAQIEWQLRKLYYRQRQFGADNGYYTEDFEKLKRDDKWSAIPQIDVTPSMFEISMPASSGRVHIRQDGYLWTEPNGK
ncbi:MAG: carbohydrate-binding family 9-like protein, partial [Tannerella sp.]|nr:carbohydrate-binding family 9-like protein [Tannerella sp.]